MHVLLVANYAPDRQESMLRFADVLERELRQRGGNVSVLAPRALLGPARAGNGVAKWLGYVDKFLLFPWQLRWVIRDLRRRGEDLVVHVCDHSNAIYTRYLQDVPHLVTCNDLLAVRSAYGEIESHRTRWSGRILQQLIVRGMNRAGSVACISNATRADVLRLTSVPQEAVRLIYMGLNYPYRVIAREERQPPLRRFILHVGGNQWYKNRLGVLRIYARMKQAASAGLPALTMVGPPFTTAMRAFVSANELANDVLELTNVTNECLQALYADAELLLYPSLAEGFGWPVVEAMASGCAVVASNRAPLTEIVGDAAGLIDPEDPAGAARVAIDVLHESAAHRQARVECGLARAERFSTSAMIDGYLDAYHVALGRSA